MPWGESFRGTLDEWWTRRKQFEKIMMASISVALVILIIILSVRNNPSSAHQEEKTCKTPICLKETDRIRQTILPQVNPCDNIYDFSCGNFWTNEDETKISLGHLQWNHYYEMAGEPVKAEDHKIVKVAKKMYQGCMDDVKIEQEHLTTIKAVLKKLGGWPLLEGDNWKGDNFNWMETIFKLRKMGYYYHSLLTITLVNDPSDDDKYMLKLSTGDMFSYQFDYDFIGNVTNQSIQIAKIFGANDTDIFKDDIMQLMKFMKKMEKIEHPQYLNTYERHTIEEYQQSVIAIDWLSFINSIIGPTTELSTNDSMLFPHSDVMIRWLDAIGKTPKRVLANYLLWKPVTVATKYMPCEIRLGVPLLRKDESRENFCLTETLARFIVNPFGIMAARRYLPAQKRQKVEELLLTFKSGLVEVLNNVEWIEESDKKKSIEKVNELKLQIGQPVDYLDDKVLDDMVVDLMENEYNDTFMSVVTQVRKNYASMEFQQLKIPRSKSLYDKSFNAAPQYLKKQHTLYVSYVAAQGLYFHYKRPQYLNYGAMGSLIGYQLSNIVSTFQSEWSAKTSTNYKEKVECMAKVMEEYLENTGDTNWNSTQNDLLTQIAAGNQLSYTIYNKWIEENGQELPLPVIHYSPSQLFWISTGMAWCRSYLPKKSEDILHNKDSKFVLKLIDVAIGNNYHFAEYFNCPTKSKMNPLKKCKIF